MGNREQDLSEGKEIEQKFVDLLVKAHPEYAFYRPNGNFKEYDISITKPDGTFIKFEIKYDRLMPKTGNVVFEIEYNGKPSGIMTTTSDYLVYYVDGKFYYTESKSLYGRIIEYEIVYGGDNNASKLILIEKNEFFRLFTAY